MALLMAHQCRPGLRRQNAFLGHNGEIVPFDANYDVLLAEFSKNICNVHERNRSCALAWPGSRSFLWNDIFAESYFSLLGPWAIFRDAVD